MIEQLAAIVYSAYRDGYHSGATEPGLVAAETLTSWECLEDEEREPWRKVVRRTLGDPVRIGIIVADEYGVDERSLMWLLKVKLDPGKYEVVVLMKKGG